MALPQGRGRVSKSGWYCGHKALARGCGFRWSCGCYYGECSISPLWRGLGDNRSWGNKGGAVNINQIRYFLDVAETGSVNQSALNLYISPQGLSRSIAQLEKGLGFELFARSNRGMTLTDEGQAFIGPALKIAQSYREFQREVSVLSSQSARWAAESLNLQVAPLLTVSDSLSKILANIGEEFPSLRINVAERNSYDMVPFAQGLSEEQLRRTCMVATVPEYQVPSYLGEGKFAVSKICEVPMVVRVDKGHPFARRQSVTRAEVARERIVCFNEPVVEEIVHHLLDEYGEPDFAFKGSIRNLLGRFPEAVLISGGYSPQGPSENVVTVPIRDTIQVHVVAITANPAPPLVAGIVECIARAYR